MITIHKFPLDFFETQYITASIIKPLKVDYQDSRAYLWAVVDTMADPQEWVVFRAGTGHNLSIPAFYNHLDSYLNTTVAASNPYVWHWFCYPLIESMDM